MSIRLYLLPWEFWNEEIPEDIDNMLRIFIKFSEVIKAKKCTSHAWIYVLTNLSNPDVRIHKVSQDDEWTFLFLEVYIFSKCGVHVGI